MLPLSGVRVLDLIGQTFADPQARRLEIAKPVSHRAPTPDAGQHTDAVLAELGLDSGEIARLRAARIVQ